MMKWNLTKCRQFYHEFIVEDKSGLLYLVGAMLMLF